MSKRKMYMLVQRTNSRTTQDDRPDFIDENPKTYYAVRRYMYGKIGLICPHCYEVIRYVNVKTDLNSKVESRLTDDEDIATSIHSSVKVNFSTNKCPKCGKMEPMTLIHVSPNITTIVSKLLKKGYDVIDCDDGQGDISDVYIYLEDNNQISDFYLSTLPSVFHIPNDESLKDDNDGILIAGLYDMNIEYDEALDELETWVDMLPNVVPEILQ